ncbi:zinc finger protein 271 [Ceratitis capitata]|uniref:(Mediterranean fruit fly) hypothetical protein n=1 Tax=Ceratitis capitata TaxID=7213 RepID=W8ALE0_CERCA|nr:zinc finger protein 271 [Ceratitis capitata]CAD6991452.1 unnamed protein product [Ceratitis capitata]
MDIACTVLNEESCRSCLQSSADTNSLDDEIEFGDGTFMLKNVYVKLLAATNVQTSTLIQETDQAVPARICTECTLKLLNSFDFICLLERSETFLKQYQQLCASKEENLSFVVTDHKNKKPYNENEDELKIEALDSEYILADYDYDKELIDDDDIRTEVEFLEDSKNSDYMEDVVEYRPEDIRDVAEYLPEDNGDVESKDEPTDDYSQDMKSEYTDHLEKKPPRFAIGSRLGTFKTTNWVKCPHCERVFARNVTLEKHIKAAHTNVPPECIAAIAPKPTQDKPIICDHCPRTFGRRFALERHMRAMHPNIEISSVELEKDMKSSVSEKSKKPYKRGICPHCGRSFAQASLVIHIRRHTGEKPYECDECHKGFPRRQDLVIHKRQHSGERPHVCTICGKSFIRPNKLSRHMRIHTGLRPYKCSECPKAFTQSNDLRIHMRRHTGEKPYKCNICNEGFISGTFLKAHRLAQNHVSPDDVEEDPYAKCRVNKEIKIE